jgi:hypothetical protein
MKREKIEEIIFQQIEEGRRYANRESRFKPTYLVVDEVTLYDIKCNFHELVLLPRNRLQLFGLNIVVCQMEGRLLEVGYTLIKVTI